MSDDRTCHLCGEHVHAQTYCGVCGHDASGRHRLEDVEGDRDALLAWARRVLPLLDALTGALGGAGDDGAEEITRALVAQAEDEALPF